MSLQINAVIDAACPSLAVMSDANRLPETIYVNPALFDEVARIRRYETDNGFPLMFLGMRLAADPRLPVDGYRLAG